MDNKKKFAVKEMYLTLQGEGAQSGRTAVFVRFSGCNLWSGLEKDRATAICQFCDTDFWGTDGEGGGKYDTDELCTLIHSLWPREQENKYVVFTGGEPALQLNTELINSLKKAHFEIAIETNGTKPLPDGIDWVCVSPKAHTELLIVSGDELKLVYPQAAALPEDYEILDFQHFYLQPMDGSAILQNTEKTIQYCMEHPKWKMSIQTHKYLEIK